jgi:uncharacterized OB-fold protein
VADSTGSSARPGGRSPGTPEAIPPLTIDGHWSFDYTYYAGDAASRFYAELTRRRIMGSRCPQCQRVLVPARGFCDACFVPTADWVEVSPHGTLETFTILTTSFPGLPEPPLVVGYVALDGASTAVLNFVTGIDLADPDAAGAALLRRPRVTARFKDACEGRITDFVFTLDGPA